MQGGPLRCAITFCNVPPEFVCKRCEQAYYCGVTHQKAHWRTGHKIGCQTADQRKRQEEKLRKVQIENLISNKRKLFRRNYVNSFTSGQYQDCLGFSYILEDTEWAHTQSAKSLTDEDVFGYGFAVCLSAKSLQLLGQISAAKAKLTHYIKTNPFLHDVDSCTATEEEDRAHYMHSKLQLISILANLSCSVGLNHNLLYVAYAQHTSAFFGPQSLEMSNVYFLIGCDWAEQGYPIKALACFKQCSRIRQVNNEACNFNIGILLFWMGKNNESILYLNEALRIREKVFGQASNQVAEIYENMGVVYLASYDFVNSNHYFQKAMYILGNPELISYKTSPEYQKLDEQVQQFFTRLCAFILTQPHEIQRPEMLLALRDSLLRSEKYPKQLVSRFKKIANDLDLSHVPYTWKEQFKQRNNSMVFSIDLNTLLKVNTQALYDQFDKSQEKLIDGAQDKDLGSSKKWKGSKKPVSNKKQEDKVDFQVKISPKIMSLINSNQLFLASQLQEKLGFILSQKKAVEELERSQFAQSLTDEQLNLLRQDNSQLYLAVVRQNPGFVVGETRTFNGSQDINQFITSMISQRVIKMPRKHIQS